MKGEVIKFDGFLKVYIESTDDDENNGNQSKMCLSIHPKYKKTCLIYSDEMLTVLLDLEDSKKIILDIYKCCYSMRKNI